MRLASSDDAVVNIRIVRYQYPHITPAPQDEQDWDANWLVINAGVHPVDRQAWSFFDPCMTTWEAADLATWLHRIAEDEIPPGERALGPEPRFTFLEPSLAFEHLGRRGGQVALAVVFDHEGSPIPQGTSEGDRKVRVLCLLGSEQVHAAADQWAEELVRHPAR